MAGENNCRALVIIPLTGRECSEVLAQAQQVGRFVASGGLCDLVEWRLDLLSPVTEGLLAQVSEVAAKVMAAAGVPLLATYRTEVEGGEGDPQLWEEFTVAALGGGAQLVDVEVTHPQLPQALAAVAGASAIVLSKHQFTGNGEGVAAAVEELRRGVDNLFDGPRHAGDTGTVIPSATEHMSQAQRREIASKVVSKLAVMVQDASGFAAVQDQLCRHPLPVTHTAVRGQLEAVPATEWGVARTDALASSQASNGAENPRSSAHLPHAAVATDAAADISLAGANTAVSSCFDLPHARSVKLDLPHARSVKLDLPDALAGGIMITMGPAGKPGRTHPQTLGSCATFAALAGQASAPGQVDASELTALDNETGCLSLN